jgi:AraC-like DNA-binding protein
MIAPAAKMLRISTDDWPEQERLEALREVYGRTIMKHDIEPIRGHDIHFKADLFSVPDLGLATSYASPCRAVRDGRKGDNDDLVLTISDRDGRIIQQRGRELALRQGEAVLMCGADTGVTIVAATTRWRSVRVPHAILRPLIDLDTCLMRPISGNSPALRLLSDYLAAVQRDEVLTRPELLDPAVAHIHELLTLTLSARDAAGIARGRGVRAARLQAIKSDVMESLSDRALSVGVIAARHGITPRYVDMLFDSEGMTFSAFVVENRLAQAYRKLTDPGLFALKISAISDDCGFQDISWFNRSFRRRYGATPSDVREAARKARNDERSF